MTALLQWKIAGCLAEATLLCLVGCGLSAQSKPDSKPASKQNPGQVEARANQAEADGEFGEAAKAFVKLVKLDSSNLTWVVRAAENLGKDRRFNDAMDLLHAARNQHGDEERVLTTLAKTYHLKADSMVAEGIFDNNVAFYYQDVKRTANQILERKPEHLEARILVASAQFQLREFDGAMQSAQLAVEAHPGDYSAQAMLGRTATERFISLRQQFNAERPSGTPGTEFLAKIDRAREQARKALNTAIPLDPDRSFPHVRLGDIDAWSGDLPSALKRYRTALSLEPAAKIDHGWLRNAVAATSRVELYTDALEQFLKRSKANAKSAAILRWYLAQAHFDSSSWKAALDGFTLAVKERPDFDETDYYRVRAAYENGNETAAAQFALEFATRSPQKFADLMRKDSLTVAILRGMAQKAYERGRFVDCRELNHVIARATQSADEWNNYALLCRETKEYAKSYEAYEVALTIEQSPQLFNDAAVILQYHLKGEENLEIARGYYERAIERAQAMLAEGSLDDKTRRRTETALRDARGNLRKL